MFKMNIISKQLTILVICIARQRNCGKVMFLNLFVCYDVTSCLVPCSFQRGYDVTSCLGHVLSRCLPPGGGLPSGGRLISCGGLRSGRYASYWTAFLYNLQIRVVSCATTG